MFKYNESLSLIIVLLLFESLMFLFVLQSFIYLQFAKCLRYALNMGGAARTSREKIKKVLTNIVLKLKRTSALHMNLFIAYRVLKIQITCMKL